MQYVAGVHTLVDSAIIAQPMQYVAGVHTLVDSAIIAQPMQYVARVHTLVGVADKWSQPLLRVASRVARVKIAVRGVLPQTLVCNFSCRYVIYK